MATAASQTTNLLLLVLLGAVAGRVVVARRTNAPWAAAFAVFLRLALVILTIRVVLQVLLVGGTGSTQLFRVPELVLPDWLAGLRVGGAVTLEATLASVADGARLGVMLLCLGAANSLAAPGRLLRVLPRGLHTFGVVTTVALGTVPTLVTAVARVRLARRLRGLPVTGLRGARTVAVPVLEEALDRSLITAAALDSRGFGRRGELSRRRRRQAYAMMLAGPALVSVGSYLALAGGANGVRGGGAGLVMLGMSACVGALRVLGSSLPATRYRPDPWRWPEWLTAGAGVACAASIVVLVSPEVLTPDPWQGQWPGMSLPAFAAVAIALLPAVSTPTSEDLA